jgi:hypothetical protein
MNATKFMRNTGVSAADFALHMASILAIVGVLPLSIDARLGIALMNSVAVLLAHSIWPVLVWRYHLISTSALVIAYGLMLYIQGPAYVLARTFGVASFQAWKGCFA